MTGYISDNQKLLDLVDLLEHELSVKEGEKAKALAAVEHLSTQRYSHNKELHKVKVELEKTKHEYE